MQDTQLLKAHLAATLLAKEPIEKFEDPANRDYLATSAIRMADTILEKICRANTTTPS